MGMIGPRKIDKPLVLYGYGRLGHLAEEIFNELKIPILGIVDKDSIDRGYKNCSLLAICVATEPYSQVIAPLIAAGWTDIVPVWDVIEYYADQVGLRNGWFDGEYTLEDNTNITAVFDKLGDILSRRSYNAFYQWRFNHVELDVPIEAGPSLPSTLADIRARQRFDDYWDSWFEHNKEIVIHNEGYELLTIEHNMPRLQKHRPKISCACYHSRDGLWKIEKLLMDSLPDYRWTFRLHGYMGQSAYIYGVPNERNINN